MIEVKRVFLVLADISGYTRFTRLHALGLLHAEQIITELLESVVSAADYPLTLNKLEGDAVFMYSAVESSSDESAVAQDVLRQVLVFFEAFKAKEQEMILAGEGGCICEACTNIADLKLKAIAHHGEAAFKRFRQFEELAGEDVIVAHRLLKNSIAGREYILMTERFYQLSGGVPGGMHESRVEDCEGIGKVPVKVYYPATSELMVPRTPPLSRPKGVAGIFVVSAKSLWSRLRQPKRSFSNIPR